MNTFQRFLVISDLGNSNFFVSISLLTLSFSIFKIALHAADLF